MNKIIADYSQTISSLEQKCNDVKKVMKEQKSRNGANDQSSGTSPLVTLTGEVHFPVSNRYDMLSSMKSAKQQTKTQSKTNSYKSRQ